MPYLLKVTWLLLNNNHAFKRSPLTHRNPAKTYPGCRIVILNNDKFEALPPRVQAAVKEAFDVVETSGEEAQRINEALLRELEV